MKTAYWAHTDRWNHTQMDETTLKVFPPHITMMMALYMTRTHPHTRPSSLPVFYIYGYDDDHGMSSYKI